MSSAKGLKSIPSVAYLNTANKPVKPFLRWVGGKSQIIEEIKANIPKNFNRYFEPFVGGGAVFFKAIPGNKLAVLNDINKNLTGAYADIKNDLNTTLFLLDKTIRDHNLLLSDTERKDFYNLKRIEYNSLITKGPSPQRTALLIFLNKTCFNGVYRENSKGEFNVPYGKPNPQTLFNNENIYLVSKKLQNVTITSGHYSEILKEAKRGDFIYLDPPYMPVSNTAHFTKYHSSDFSDADQRELAHLFSSLDKRGCFLMLSNSDMPFIRELYKKYEKYTISLNANRNINCKGNLRKPVKELLIRNYY